jgi:uncharacterized protein YcgI (DUF1989 family)
VVGSYREGLLEEIYIPAGEGRAFVVKKGQLFRIKQIEGRQVADVILLNLNNPKEGFHAGHSVYLNCIKGIGNIKKLKELYSRPPYENVMATIIKDTVGIHFAYIGSRCSRMIYKLRDNIDAPPHRTCQDNLTEAIAHYGLGPEDVPDVLNLWVDVDINEKGCFVLKPSPAGKDDYIDIKAEMDLIIGVSSCPNDTQPINEYKVKPLKVIIFERTL